MFRRSLAASTIFEEPSELDNTIDAGSECPTGGLRSSRNSTPLVATNDTIEPAGHYGIQRNQTTIAKQVTTVVATRPPWCSWCGQRRSCHRHCCQ
jgi:hypothetical protein